MHNANSDEHDEYGFSSDLASVRIKMMDKRMQKLDTLAKELPLPKLYGDKEAPTTIVSWGSTKGPLLAALELLQKEGKKLKFLQIVNLSPFPVKYVSEVLENSRQVILVENNKTGQLGDLIREQTGIKIEQRILKYDGRQFYPEELFLKIKEVLKDA